MIFLSILFASPLIGRAESVDFFKGTIVEALEVARSQGKLLLVEFYAPWSHKSRWMHDNVLIKSTASRSFVVVLLNTETEQGAAFALQYEVTDYPVLLICTSGGVVIDKIDRAMELSDFEARLTTACISTDKQSVRQLQQIFSLCESEDSTTRTQVNELVRKYLADQDIEILLSQSHWDIFSTPSITYYGSSSYDFLINHAEDFFSAKIAKARIEAIISGVLMPYIIGSEVFDEHFISTIESDTISLAHYPIALDMCRLARLREQKSVNQYIPLLRHVIDNVSEDYEYPLVMSLDFVAQQLSKSDRINRTEARRMLEKLKQKSSSPSKTALIELLLTKFS